MNKPTDKAKAFMEANDKSGVASGAAHGAGNGGTYTLMDGSSFRLSFDDCLSIPDGYPKWHIPGDTYSPHDAQVQAFITELKRQDVNYIEDVGNGEFIIDGVVNVRAALDAATAVERDGSATDTKGNADG